METWVFQDVKKTLPEGEWQKEPDKAQWIDEKTGLDCLIIRGPMGALCGYVGVPPSHYAYEVDYNDDKFGNIKIHWGLTFSGLCQEDTDRGICHTGEVANEKVWWLGFDCAHSMDLCPMLMESVTSFWDDIYRNFDYVKRETARLAEQLK